MKILMINTVCGIGSTGIICTDLAEMLTEKGHDVKIAYGRGYVPEKYRKYAIRIGNEIDVKCHALSSRIFDNTGFSSRVVTKKFVNWIKDYNPDVIHIHNIHGYYINIAILFDFLSVFDKRVVWTLHDCWCFTGHCVHFSTIDCQKWKTGCNNCPQTKEYPASLAFDNSTSNWTRKRNLFTSVKNMTLITPSNWLAELVKESFMGKFPVKVINNGIDTEVFKPISSNFKQKHNIQDKRVLLGVSNQWIKRKGYNDFLKLAEQISDEYIIVLVGLSDKQLKEIPSNIIGIIHTNDVKELAEIYTAADVFLNLTYEDNYPTVNLEAQACGTPVITYNTGGSVDENVVTQGDINQLLNAIKKVDRNKLTNIISKKEMCSKYIHELLRPLQPKGG